MVVEKVLPWANLAYIVLVALGSYTIYQLNALVNANKDRELESYQADASAQIEQARTEALKADARAAEANAAADQARLEIARLKQPRTISPQHQARISAVLSAYAGQTYSFIAYEDAEAHDLLVQIDAVLRQADWRRVPSWKGVMVREIAGNTVGTSAKSGVAAYIGPDYAEGDEVLLTFSAMLTSAGIACQPNRDKNWGEKEPKTIIIEVGKKPVE